VLTAISEPCHLALVASPLPMVLHIGQYNQKKIKIGVYLLEQTMVQLEPIGLNSDLDVAA